MAETNPCYVLNSESHTAEQFRRMLHTVVGDDYGVVEGLEVTESDTPGMSVKVTAGRCIIAGDEATFQGSYFCEAESSTTLTISAADGSNARIDRIVAKVQDAEYSGATSEWSLAVVTGTPAGSPVAPTAPDNSITLATVNVPASDTSITNAQITDSRSWLYLKGNAIEVLTSSTRPTDDSLSEGRIIYETDTERLVGYTGAAWGVIGDLGAWDSYTPTLVQFASVTCTASCHYVQEGKTVHAWGKVVVTGTGSTGDRLITLSLPVTAARNDRVVGAGMCYDAGTGNISGEAIYLATTTTMCFYPTSSIAAHIGEGRTLAGNLWNNAALAANDVMWFDITYEAA